MVLSVDGSVAVATGSQTTTLSGSITTSLTNDLIYASVHVNSGDLLTNISDGASLTWNQLSKFADGSGGESYLYDAVSAGTLSSDSITVTTSSNSFIQFVAIGINGANTSTPRDTNASIPASATGNGATSTVTGVSTSNANDIILVIGFWAAGGNTSTGPSGYTLITGSDTSASQPFYYKVVSATQSSQSFSITFNASNFWLSVVDAIQAAAGTVALNTMEFTGKMALKNNPGTFVNG